MAIYQAFGTIRDMRLFFLTTLVMTAFAANSVLARLAMVSNSIGPSNFALLSWIRCFSNILSRSDYSKKNS